MSDDGELFVDAQESFDDVKASKIVIDPNVPLEDRYPVHKAIFQLESVVNVRNLIHNLVREELEKCTEKDENDCNRMEAILLSIVSQKDRHGNTPLHLAVMTGQRDVVTLLLEYDAPVKSRNQQGWTPLDEATSYGSRETIKRLLITARHQAKHRMTSRRTKLVQALKLLDDFKLQLKWEFYSWVPFVNRFMPSDTCNISKRGSAIRLDTTLVDFQGITWQKGDLSFVFNGDKANSSVYMLDNELKVYQVLRNSLKNGRSSADIKDVELEQDVDLLMSTDIISPTLNGKTISFTNVQSGWWFSRYNKTEKVGSFRSTFYNINNLSLDSIKRREHLTEEDIQANKQLLKALKNHLDTKSSQHQRKLSAPAISSDRKSPTATKRAQRARTVEMVEGNGDFRNSKMEFHDLDPLPGEEDNDRHSTGSTSSDDSEPEENDGYESEEEVDEDELNRAMAKQISLANTRRQSLAPPPRPAYTWSEYINAPLDSPPCLGRPWKIKKSSKSFKPTLAMSEDFPLSISSILSILEVIAPFKHFSKLNEFIQLNLPPGFPVKLDLPIVPTLLARVTFLNFEFAHNLPESLFNVPSDYTETTDRFRDLYSGQ